MSDERGQRIVKICQAINCNTYISPIGAASYIEQDNPGGYFPAHGIELMYQHYEHPTYNQLYGNFISHMGIIDVLFNHGFKEGRGNIQSGRRQLIHYLENHKMIVKE